jgi:hypothetical protein
MQRIVKAPFICLGVISGTPKLKGTRRCRSDIPPENGTGGVISNVLDYTHRVRQFLDPSKKGTPLGSDVVADTSGAAGAAGAHMLVPPSWHLYSTHTYGLGLETATDRGHLFTGHQGAIAGYMAAMYWFAELHWGFVALQNRYSFASYMIQSKLMADFLDSFGAQGEAYDTRGMTREGIRYCKVCRPLVPLA